MRKRRLLKKNCKLFSFLSGSEACHTDDGVAAVAVTEPINYSSRNSYSNKFQSVISYLKCGRTLKPRSLLFIDALN